MGAGSLCLALRRNVSPGLRNGGLPALCLHVAASQLQEAPEGLPTGQWNEPEGQPREPQELSYFSSWVHGPQDLEERPVAPDAAMTGGPCVVRWSTCPTPQQPAVTLGSDPRSVAQSPSSEPHEQCTDPGPVRVRRGNPMPTPLLLAPPQPSSPDPKAAVMMPPGCVLQGAAGPPGAELALSPGSQAWLWAGLQVLMTPPPTSRSFTGAFMVGGGGCQILDSGTCIHTML